MRGSLFMETIIYSKDTNFLNPLPPTEKTSCMLMAARIGAEVFI